MKVFFVKWNNWDAVKCVVDQYELIVGVSAGPRILSITCEGNENLLYQDTSGFSVGDWRIYGGHRFTLAPEGPDSYFPDNSRCDLKILSTKLVVTAPERPNGLLLSMEISEGIGGGSFEIDHILKNNGNKNWNGALWAITCVPRYSNILAHCNNTAKINFWPGTDPLNWNVVDKYMTVKSGNFRGKVGWHYLHPKLAALQQHGTVIIHSSDLSYPNECIDNGSNVEIFVCSAFAELETLSKNLNILPGESAHHLQQWQLFFH